MPAKTMLFDQRVRSLHDFGPGPHNFLSFNPQGRLLIVAGFGNLAGKLNIYDRRSLNKIATIDAPNTSHCEWSPDGRFILTATLSPRLRVDNGIKIWYCSGPLIHLQNTEELYQASWRPANVDGAPAFPAQIPPAPAPNASVEAAEASVSKPAAPKPMGAYRPPGARGLATPAIFKREDEGGLPTNGTSTPPRYSRTPVPGAPGYANGNGNAGRRQVPGAPPPGGAGPSNDGEKKGNKKRKGGKKEGDDRGKKASGSATPATPAAADAAPAVEPEQLAAAVGDLGLDANAKKARNLNKKVSGPQFFVSAMS